MTTAAYRSLQEHVDRALALATQIRDVRAVRNPWEQEAARIAHVRLEATATTLASLRQKAEEGSTGI